jgi:hypothetical protein
MRTLLMATAMAVVIAGATPALAKKKPEITPMQLQAIQSKEFEATKDDVFASIMTVFQDLGYQVNSAEMNTGFITAESATHNKTSFWDAMAKQSGSGNTRATAFVEKMPNGMTRVRLNFMNTKSVSGMWGRNSREDKPVLEPRTYQIAWEKIDEALFVRHAVGSKAPASADKGSTPPK